jgi:twitching motility protein PilT
MTSTTAGRLVYTERFMDRNAFHKLLAFGVERGVSDIHFEVGYPPHYRLHGELLGAIKVPPLTAPDTESIARMILEDRNLTVDFTRRFAEIDVSYALAERGRFRASIFRQRGAVGIVMRLIAIQVLSLEQLNLPPVLAEISDARRGLVLVTGATGNGKTTTMAAMLRHINETRHAHIVTIEDPIEFIHEPQKCMIIQREVGSDTESFRDAITAAMRQDPDVILVGEIRERETAATCLKAAETGHLVVSAIHTPDAVSTVQRYLGLFETEAVDVIRSRLGDCLQAIISLRLIASKDGRRRLPAVEILRVTRTIRECLRAGRMAEIPELIRKGRDLYSMQLFDQHLIDLVNSGLISMETAIYASSNPEEFERALRVE